MITIAKILSFVRGTDNDAKVSNVKIDLGGGDNKTARHFSAPGDDSFPLTTDYALVSDILRNGGKVVVGYLDPVNDPVAQEGEVRRYARDPVIGAAVNQIWLKTDGSILMSNAAGSIELQAGGSVVINGVTIDPTGNISGVDTLDADTVNATTSLTAATKELAGHIHSGVTAGAANSGPNV